MMMRCTALAMLLTLLWNCSKPTAGTTSETENEIAVRIVLPNGDPVSSARVYLIHATQFDSLVRLGQSPRIDSAITNELGQATLTSSAEIDRWNIYAQAPGYAALDRSVSSTMTQREIQLNPSQSLSGTATPGALIAIDGSGILAQANAQGIYEMQNLPQGQFALIEVLPSQQTRIYGRLWVDSNSTRTLVDTVSGVLIDDFDDGDAYPWLMDLGAGGPWYFYSDQVGSTVYPSEAFNNPAMLMTDSNAWQGKSLHMQMILDTTKTTPYVSIACKMGPQNGLGRVNLSELDSISFMAQGTGQFRVVFATDYIHTNYPSSEAGSDLGYVFTAPETWTRITVPVDQLTPPLGSQPEEDGITWLNVAQATDLLVFGSWDSPGTALMLSIDEIRLYGIHYSIFHQ